MERVVHSFLTSLNRPLVAVFICTDQEEKQVVNNILKHYYPPRLTLMLYVVARQHPHYSTFPINYLRNLAIVNIRTTHFIVLDLDLRVTSMIRTIFHSFTRKYLFRN